MNTQRDLNLLTPKVKSAAEQLLKLHPEIFITETGRTIERQKELVKAGFSKTMDSKHLTGLAFDIAFNGKELYPTDESKWRKVADDAKKLGLDWGGDLWVKSGFIDKPHFQLSDNIQNMDVKLIQFPDNFVKLSEKEVRVTTVSHNHAADDTVPEQMKGCSELISDRKSKKIIEMLIELLSKDDKYKDLAEIYKKLLTELSWTK